MKKTIFICSFAMQLLSSVAYATDLADTLVSTYQHNPDLNAERENLKAIDETMAQARAQFLPTAQASSSSIKNHDKTKTAQLNQYSPYINSKTRNYETQQSISVTQNVFNGLQSVNTLKSAKDQIEIGRLQYLSKEQQILLNGIKAHLNVILAEENLKLSNNNVERLTRVLASIEERFQLGEVTKTDVSQAKAQLSGAVTNKTQSYGNLTKAKSDYKKIVGLDADSLVTPEIDSDLPVSLEEAQQIALNENMDFLSSKISEGLYKTQINVAKGALLPQINVIAQANTSLVPNQTYQTKIKTLDRNMIMQVSVPIYSGGKEYSDVRKAKRNYQKSKFNSSSAYNNLISSVVSTWQDFETYTSSVHSSEEQVLAAQIALDGINEEAKLGTKTTLDVLDAEQTLYQAQTSNISAKINRLASYYTVKSVLGRLTARDLSLPVEQFDMLANYKKTKFKLIGF